MRKIFIEKNMQSEIMKRLVYLREMTSVYKYGIAHKAMYKNYKNALNAYEVTDKEVVMWKGKNSIKSKLKRRNHK